MGCKVDKIIKLKIYCRKIPNSNSFLNFKNIKRTFLNCLKRLIIQVILNLFTTYFFLLILSFAATFIQKILFIFVQDILRILFLHKIAILHEINQYIF